MIRSEIEVVNKLGLHARASAKLAQLSSRFSSRIKLEQAGKSVDCKSIMGIMMLAAGIGTQLELVVDGEDEDEAHAAVTALFADKFGEGE